MISTWVLVILWCGGQRFRSKITFVHLGLRLGIPKDYLVKVAEISSWDVIPVLTATWMCPLHISFLWSGMPGVSLETGRKANYKKNYVHSAFYGVWWFSVSLKLQWLSAKYLLLKDKMPKSWGWITVLSHLLWEQYGAKTVTTSNYWEWYRFVRFPAASFILLFGLLGKVQEAWIS